MGAPRFFRLGVLVALAGCATPAAPTGGPVDSTPPSLVSAIPADQSTLVTDSTVTLVFSERLDGASAAAVSVTPTSATPPEVRVDGREIRISLPTLRDSTTYVVTLGTALKDNHGVALRSPITFAFATGDTIDRATISGRVRDPSTGAGVRATVWAYALADSASAPAVDTPPDYRTETGADGAFTLSYLRRAPYVVVAVQDRNRNDRIDAGERIAVSPRAVLRADTTASEPEPFWIAATDTIPPRAQRVRTLSDRRLAVRFDESVRLFASDASGWIVADSASGRPVEVRVYQPADAPQEVYVEAGTALPPVPHRVTYTPGGPPALLTDSSGVAAEQFALTFTPPTRADTVTARFLGFAPSTQDSVVTLAPGQRPRARFSSPQSDDAIAQRVRLVADGSPPTNPLIDADGTTVVPTADLPTQFALEVEMPDSTYRQRFAVAGARETGGIVGQVDGAGPIRVEVRPQSGDPIMVTADAQGAFAVNGLLPGPYTLRIWRDLDEDGAWTSGTLSPYTAPEPLRLLLDPIQVRARWETEIDPVTL